MKMLRSRHSLPSSHQQGKKTRKWWTLITRKARKIKCIMFDLGDVIVKNNPDKVCRRLAKSCPLTPDEVAWFAPEEVHELIDTGKMSSRELYLLAVKNLGLKRVSQKKFEQIFGDMFTNNIPVQKIAKKLIDNYRLVLVSNTNEIHFQNIRKNFPIIKIFDAIVLSYE